MFRGSEDNTFGYPHGLFLFADCLPLHLYFIMKGI